MPASRQYSSPLRERHAQQTRDLIIDAVTNLLESHRIDEVTTREIAQSAGVSERTVYRHFPDRNALLAGLTGRLMRSLGDEQNPMNLRVETIDDLKVTAVRLMLGLEKFHVATLEVDAGPILAQVAVPVLDDDDEASLHERIKAVERRLYPDTIRAVLADPTLLTKEPHRP